VTSQRGQSHGGQDALTFHVAALGAPFRGLFEAPWDEASAGWATRYRDRPEVDVTVPSDAVLLDVILQASEALGVTAGEWTREDGQQTELRDLFTFVAFYSPQDRREYRGAEPEMWGLTVVDEDGLAYRKRWQEVPVADLLRAARREDVGIVRAGAVAAAGTLIDPVGAPIAADRALIVGAGPSGLELGIVMPSWM
jgi:hypothetical protein